MSSPVALLYMATERHVGAWQWKCAAASLPSALNVPVMVWVQVPSAFWTAEIQQRCKRKYFLRSQELG